MSNCKPAITSCESAAAKAVSLGGYLNRQDEGVMLPNTSLIEKGLCKKHYVGDTKLSGLRLHQPDSM